MSKSSAPSSLRRFFDRVVHRSFGDLALDYPLFMTGLFRECLEHLSVTRYYIREGRRSYRFVSEDDRADARPEARRKVYFRPEHGTPDLPFFRRLVTEW